MAGYGNALSFKDLCDKDIKETEKYIRTRTLYILQKRLNESMHIGDDGEALVDDDILVEYFGEAYANDSKNFEFLPGDVKLIKQLVAHVKMLVDGKGLNKGLKLFDLPKSRKPLNGTQTIKVDKLVPKQENSEQNEKKNQESDNDGQQQLKSSLFQKIMDCLRSYNANQFVDLENVSQDIVKVDTENGKICGTVQCVICRNKTGKDVQAKKVSYHCGGTSQYWIPSNFITHLKRIHKLSSDDNKLKQATAHSTSNKKMKQDFNNDQSLILIQAEAVPSNNAQNDSKFWFDQITKQVTAMTSNVLHHNEQQHDIEFELTENHSSTIKVVQSPGDGNCLFWSLSYQLCEQKMSGSELKKEQKLMRANVVKYINEHYDSFKQAIRGRVIYSEASEAFTGDLEKDCFFFVNQLLPRSRFWGGSETLIAVSEIYKVNIIVFNEKGRFEITKNTLGETYEKSIFVAYRKNHYDSVTDITSSDCTELAKFLSNK